MMTISHEALQRALRHALDVSDVAGDNIPDYVIIPVEDMATVTDGLYKEIRREERRIDDASQPA